ncbi:hypothetical protein Misp06_03034 [Microbulbifer sp. NBRC 101763]
MADSNVTESLFRRACGYSHEAVKIMQHNGNPIVQEYTEHYPPDTTACLAWLHNRQREKRQRNPDQASDGAYMPPTNSYSRSRMQERGREMRAAFNVPQGQFLNLPHKCSAYVAGSGSGKIWVGCSGQLAHFTACINLIKQRNR